VIWSELYGPDGWSTGGAKRTKTWNKYLPGGKTWFASQIMQNDLLSHTQWEAFVYPVWRRVWQTRPGVQGNCWIEFLTECSKEWTYTFWTLLLIIMRTSYNANEKSAYRAGCVSAYFNWTEFNKIWYWKILRKSVEPHQCFFKLDIFNGDFTRRRACIFEDIPLNTHERGESFEQKP
jgi:hypothetical protein